jgi:hypothetical protein
LGSIKKSGTPLQMIEIADRRNWDVATQKRLRHLTNADAERCRGPRLLIESRAIVNGPSQPASIW